MPVDKRYYEKHIGFFNKKIKSIFADDMIKISEECNFRNRGFFRITYRYVPFDYKILIENEFRTFDIIVYDSEGASNVLNHIEQHNSDLDEDNIAESIMLLKKILVRNDFDLYFSIGNKLYRKNKKGIKRVKDIKGKRSITECL